MQPHYSERLSNDHSNSLDIRCDRCKKKRLNAAIKPSCQPTVIPPSCSVLTLQWLTHILLSHLKSSCSLLVSSKCLHSAFLMLQSLGSMQMGGMVLLVQWLEFHWGLWLLDFHFGILERESDMLLLRGGLFLGERWPKV